MFSPRHTITHLNYQCALTLTVGPLSLFSFLLRYNVPPCCFLQSVEHSIKHNLSPVLQLPSFFLSFLIVGTKISRQFSWNWVFHPQNQLRCKFWGKTGLLRVRIYHIQYSLICPHLFFTFADSITLTISSHHRPTGCLTEPNGIIFTPSSWRKTDDSSITWKTKSLS